MAPTPLCIAGPPPSLQLDAFNKKVINLNI